MTFACNARDESDGALSLSAQQRPRLDEAALCPRSALGLLWIAQSTVHAKEEVL